MADINASALADMLRGVADAVEREKDELSKLDGVIGDGDHGVTMSIGFTAVGKALDETEPGDPTGVLNLVAKTFLSAVGASAGPLYATAFMRAGAAVKGRETLDAEGMADVIIAMAEGVRHRGKAEPGEKTMVDAWQPAADAAEGARGSASIADVLTAAADAAQAGAEGTKEMVATKGRSANLGDRSLGHMDPGAASTALILRTLADHVKD